MPRSPPSIPPPRIVTTYRTSPDRRTHCEPLPPSSLIIRNPSRNRAGFRRYPLFPLPGPGHAHIPASWRTLLSMLYRTNVQYSYRRLGRSVYGAEDSRRLWFDCVRRFGEIFSRSENQMSPTEIVEPDSRSDPCTCKPSTIARQCHPTRCLQCSQRPIQLQPLHSRVSFRSTPCHASRLQRRTRSCPPNCGARFRSRAPANLELRTCHVRNIVIEAARDHDRKTI